MKRKTTPKRSTWKTANGPKTLKEMGLNKTAYRKENQRIADHLIKQGFEFWDHCCIYDHNDFNGYTITFRKQVFADHVVWFSWHWVDEGFVYWQGEMSVTLDLNPKMKTLHPYLRNEVNYITSQSLHLTPHYETFLLRAREVNSGWLGLVSITEDY